MRGLLRWLGPWRAEGATASRLGVVFLVALAWDVIVALEGETAVGSTGAGLVLAVAAYPVLALLSAAALLSPAGRWLRSRWWPALVSISRPLLLVMLVVVAVQVPSFVSPGARVLTDVTPSVICAARDLLRGQDPYRTPELLCLHRLGVPVVEATPLQLGALAHQRRYPSQARLRSLERTASTHGYRSREFPLFGYPPMSFVWMLPVAGAARNWWAIWTLCLAALWMLALARISRRWWPVVLVVVLLQWGTGSALSAATQGDSEFFTFALMALSLFLIDAPRRSAVALGLAAASNPLAWIMVPGYLALCLHLGQRRRRLLWLVGTAALAVVPWILVFPDTLPGMAALIRQPAFAFGVGLTALNVVQPIAPLLPKAFYFALLGVGEVAVVALAATGRRLAPAAPVLAVALMWASWRSEANYLGQLPLLACAMAVGLDRLGWTGWRRVAVAAGASPPLAALEGR